MAAVTQDRSALAEASREMWDSPIGGAYLIWRFVCGYSRAVERDPSVLLIYPAIAIVLNSSFAIEITRSSNLSDFAYAFHDSSGKCAKSLSGLQEQIAGLKGWILKSLEFALVIRLVELSPETGCVSAVRRSEAVSSQAFARGFKDEDGLRAESLGAVFARTNEQNVAYYLGLGSDENATQEDIPCAPWNARTQGL